MALDALRCNHLAPLSFKGLNDQIAVTDLKLVLSSLSQLHSVSRAEPGRAVIRYQRPYSCTLETGSRPDKTVLSRPRRRCEQAIRTAIVPANACTDAFLSLTICYSISWHDGWPCHH